MISVIIPTYNRKGTLSVALNSVLKQTWRDFEVVVVDDASTDRTGDWLKENYTDSRIRYERLEKNSGVAAARNCGLDVAKGDYIVFLDSDDELLPHALEKGLQALASTPFGIVTAPFRSDNGELTGVDAPEGELSFVDVLAEKYMRPKKNCFHMMKREAIGHIRFEVKNLDFIFYRRVESRTRIFALEAPLGIYHDVGESTMTKARKKSDAALSIARARALLSFLDEFGDLLKAQRPLMYSFYAYGAAVGLLLSGEPVLARKLAWLAYVSQPRLKYFAFALFAHLPLSAALLRLAFTVKKML